MQEQPPAGQLGGVIAHPLPRCGCASASWLRRQLCAGNAALDGHTSADAFAQPACWRLRRLQPASAATLPWRAIAVTNSQWLRPAGAAGFQRSDLAGGDFYIDLCWGHNRACSVGMAAKWSSICSAVGCCERTWPRGCQCLLSKFVQVAVPTCVVSSKEMSLSSKLRSAVSCTHVCAHAFGTWGFATAFKCWGCLSSRASPTGLVAMPSLRHWGLARTSAALLIKFGVPLAFLSAIEYVLQQNGGTIVRDLDVVELFSGKGNLAAE